VIKEESECVLHGKSLCKERTWERTA